MTGDFIIFGSPKIEQPEIDEVIDSLRSGWLGTGPKVAAFERAFAAYKGVNSAVALNSCTAALHLSVLAAGIRPGDEVITTPLTFCATVNAIIHAGATPVLADVDPVSMNIDPTEVERKLSPRTKAILPVHFAGRPCDMNALNAIADRYDLRIIEDCAHAIETEYEGRKAGTLGHFGCFSFYVTKNVVTGEGGMVIARNPEDLERIKILGLHGMSRDAWKRFSDAGYKHYQVVECGFKYNMMDLQAAIGIHQLRRVEASWTRRRQIWRKYDDAFAELPLTLPARPEAGARHGYHLYTILVDEKRVGLSRDKFMDRLHAEGVGTGVHYLSVPEHEFYRSRFGWSAQEFPNAMAIGRQTVSVPLSAKLSDDEATRVIEAVRLTSLAQA